MDYVVIERGVFDQIPGLLGTLCHADSVYIVTDSNVAVHYLTPLEEGLKKLGHRVASYVLKPGEQAKSSENVQTLYHWLHEEMADRASVLVALGGGVVSDLAGFVASTYMRGITLINVPTSLLAQVDAGIGGKTAINYCGVKNLVGSFYDPIKVFIDPDLLTTLPHAEIVNGAGELLKYAILIGDDFHKTLSMSPSIEVIRRSAEYKLRIVTEDKLERGKRITLNCGHTIAHALEAGLPKGYISHGQAVALGCLIEAHIGSMLNLTHADFLVELNKVCRSLGLLQQLPNEFRAYAKGILNKISSDKKRRAGKVNWVLPVGWGTVKVTDGVCLENVECAIESVFVSETD